jgi:hypothetical protein
MATGDDSVTKGGSREYMSEPWYKPSLNGMAQGELDTNKKSHGYGPYADEGYAFVTIEQYVSAVAMWYDEARCRV